MKTELLYIDKFVAFLEYVELNEYHIKMAFKGHVTSQHLEYLIQIAQYHLKANNDDNIRGWISFILNLSKKDKLILQDIVLDK